jgi:hypothetical protein
MRPWTSTWFALAALAVVGCGGNGGNNGSSNVTVGQGPATGVVGGVVLEAAPGLPPLAGAMVSVIAGGQAFPGTTDMTGTFSVKEVPVGSLVVKISAADHFDVYLTTQLATNSGNFPVTNAVATVGPVALIGNKGTVAFRVVDENGAPAGGVPATGRTLTSYLDLSSGSPVARGVAEAAATSDQTGLVTLSGLPDFVALGPLVSDSLTVNLPPRKITGGGATSYEFLGLTLPVTPTQWSPTLGQTPTVVLAGPRSPLNVISSSLDCFETAQSGACNAGPLGSQVQPGGGVTIAFNQAVGKDSLHATLLNEFGSLASANAMWTVTDNLVNITFSKPLDPGNRYNLVFHADAAYADQSKEYDVTAPFFVPQPAGTAVTISPASRMDQNMNDYIIVFSEPIGVGVGSTAPIPCVVYYEADLDGNPNVTSPGEWNSGGNATLTCESNFTPAHAGLFLRPSEPFIGATTTPLTGYTTQWRLSVRNVCVGMYQCSTSNRSVHLVFSRNPDPGSVMKRSSGALVPDLPPFALPSF